MLVVFFIFCITGILTAADGATLSPPEDLPYRASLLSASHPDTWTYRSVFQQHCAQRLKELANLFQPPEKALEHLLHNQRDTIIAAFPNHPFLLDIKSYLVPHYIKDFHKLTGWLGWVRGLIIVDYIQAGKIDEYPHLDRETIEKSLKAQKLGDLSDHSEAINQTLFVLKIAMEETNVTPVMLPCPEGEFTMLDYVLSLKIGKLICPCALDYSKSTLWLSHNGGYSGLLDNLFGHDMGAHIPMVIISGELLNSAFFPKKPGQSVLQTLAEHLLNQLESVIPEEPGLLQTELEQYRPFAHKLLSIFNFTHEYCLFYPGRTFHSRTHSYVKNNPKWHNGMCSIISALNHHCTNDEAFNILAQSIEDLDLEHYANTQARIKKFEEIDSQLFPPEKFSAQEKFQTLIQKALQIIDEPDILPVFTPESSIAKTLQRCTPKNVHWVIYDGPYCIPHIYSDKEHDVYLYFPSQTPTKVHQKSLAFCTAMIHSPNLYGTPAHMLCAIKHLLRKAVT